MDWRAIETAPEDGTAILLWVRSRARGGECNAAVGGFVRTANKWLLCGAGWMSRTRDGELHYVERAEVTHWAPIDPPADIAPGLTTRRRTVDAATTTRSPMPTQ